MFKIACTTLFLCLLNMLLPSQIIQAAPQTANPPTVRELTIPSHGKRLTGFSYLAAGAGPHPTILLLHGFPGNEKNLDVAQAMRSMGWNVVFFHYRGAWGSEGKFSFSGSEKDVTSVLNYMNDEKNAEYLRIDRNRISLVGHSMGGHMAVAGILDNPQVRCSVVYDGANLGAYSRSRFGSEEASKSWEAYSDTLFMLNGWSGKKAMKELKEKGPQLDLIERVNTLKGRPVFFIAADSAVISLQKMILPLVEAMKSTKDSKISYELISDGHSFSATRQKLINSTAKFLQQSCE